MSHSPARCVFASVVRAVVLLPLIDCFSVFLSIFFFFFNDTATTEIYTLSLHDALPICRAVHFLAHLVEAVLGRPADCLDEVDRKSTRLNSSHLGISYAVFCLKKKKKKKNKNKDTNKSNRTTHDVNIQPERQEKLEHGNQ